MIETIEFLDRQVERVRLSIAEQEEELGRTERRIGQSVDLAYRRVERMVVKRAVEAKKLVERLEQLKTSVVHHGKVYLADHDNLIVQPAHHR